MRKSKQTMMLLLGFLCLFASFNTRAEPTQEETVEERMAKAEALQLTDWVDEEGFLVDAFFDGKSDSQISNMGLDGLVRVLSAEELEARVAHLNAGISPFLVTAYEKVSQKNPDTGALLYTGFFEVDGRLAYCIERSVATPAKGSETGTPKEVTNNKIRKVLYYGYNGPKDKGYTHVETALAAAEANGDGDNSLGRNVLAEIVGFAVPPDSFQVWKVSTNGGQTQDLAYYTIVPDGYIQIKKVSADTTITEGNPNYSLKGAVYTVYQDKACENEITTMTTKEDGFTKDVAFAPGTYYVKETKSPKGYDLDSTVHKAVVKSSIVTAIEVEDEPQLVVPKKLIQKVDAETGEASPQGYGSFENAEFLVRFYKELYEEGVDPATLGETPDGEWWFRSNAAGMMRFGVNFFLQGDSLRENASGFGRLPMGTLTIQEVKAPVGYRVQPTVFVKQMTEPVSGIGAFELEEPIIQVTIQKVKEGTTEKLPGAVFEYESPSGQTEQFVTDAEGKIMLKGLPVGVHRLQEIQAPEGYELNASAIIIRVREDGNILAEGNVEIKTLEDENLLITIENSETQEQLSKRLPETGDVAVALNMMTGFGCIVTTIIRKKRRLTI